MGTMQELRSNLQLLLDRRQFHETEAAFIDQELQEASAALAEVGVGSTTDLPTKPTNSVPTKLMSTTHVGILKERTFNILKAAKEPLAVEDVAMQMIRDGYEGGDPIALINEVYNNGIQPLMRDGLVASSGGGRDMKYRLQWLDRTSYLAK